MVYFEEYVLKLFKEKSNKNIYLLIQTCFPCSSFINLNRKINMITESNLLSLEADRFTYFNIKL